MSTYVAEARLRVDAVNRTVRTFIQAVVAEAVIVVLPELQRLVADEATKWDINVAVSVGRVALMAALSYAMRRYVDPSRVPTPLPPATPGSPTTPPVH